MAMICHEVFSEAELAGSPMVFLIGSPRCFLHHRWPGSTRLTIRSWWLMKVVGLDDEAETRKYLRTAAFWFSAELANWRVYTNRTHHELTWEIIRGTSMYSLGGLSLEHLFGSFQEESHGYHCVVFCLEQFLAQVGLTLAQHTSSGPKINNMFIWKVASGPRWTRFLPSIGWRKAGSRWPNVGITNDGIEGIDWIYIDLDSI